MLPPAHPHTQISIGTCQHNGGASTTRVVIRKEDTPPTYYVQCWLHGQNNTSTIEHDLLIQKQKSSLSTVEFRRCRFYLSYRLISSDRGHVDRTFRHFSWSTPYMTDSLLAVFARRISRNRRNAAKRQRQPCVYSSVPKLNRRLPRTLLYIRLPFNRVRHGRNPETRIAAGASTWPPRDLICSATTHKQHGTI